MTKTQEIMKRLMTKLLNLPGVIVEDSKETGELLILSVRVEKKKESYDSNND